MNTSSLVKTFEAQLDSALPLPSGPHRLVYEAARYSLHSGGKRLRPLLVLTTAQALQGNLERAYPFAVALEMIHTYSLIHDDLPGMDDDNFRRGKPTLHKAYNEGQAILAGDLLLTQAFEHILKATVFTSDEKVEALSILAQEAGGEGMIGGQSIDLQGTAKTTKSLNLLHSMKTGALFQAAVELGALSAKASHNTRKALRRFAYSLGLAFQIMDDVLDVTHAKEKHGKETSSDFDNHKITYATLMGIEPSKKAAEELLNIALKELDELECEFVDLKNLANYLVYRESAWKLTFF